MFLSSHFSGSNLIKDRILYILNISKFVGPLVFASPWRYTSMCKDSDPEDSMRRRFEAVVAEAQEKICKAIEEPMPYRACGSCGSCGSCDGNDI